MLQLIAAFSIWAGGAGLGALWALPSIPGLPLWSVCVCFINVLVVYGLVVHGGRQSRAR